MIEKKGKNILLPFKRSNRNRLSTPIIVAAAVLPDLLYAAAEAKKEGITLGLKGVKLNAYIANKSGVISVPK